MTDHTPFTPPGGSMPPPPPPAPYAPPPGSLPMYGQGPIPASPPPPQRRLGRGAIAVIVGGSVVVFCILIGGLAAATNALAEVFWNNAPATLSGEPLVTGDEASPVAVEPLHCDGGCFTHNDIGATIIDQDELDALGLTSTIEPWTDDLYTYPHDAGYLARGWHGANSSPDECFMTFPQAPISILETPPIEDDHSEISYTGVWAVGDEYPQLRQATRVFANDEDAVAYMAVVSDAVAGCTHYETGTGDSHWEADVTPAPALQLPASVAGIGWVENSGYARYYAFDVQRGNVVVRTALGTDDRISELEFRALVEHLAGQLVDVTPAQ